MTGARLPATRLPQRLDLLIEPRDVEGRLERVLVEGRHADQQTLTAEETFDERDRARASPEPERPIVIRLSHRNAARGPVVDPIVDPIQIGKVPRNHVAPGIEVDVRRVLLTADHEVNWSRSVPTAIGRGARARIHDNKRAVVQRGLRLPDTPGGKAALDFATPFPVAWRKLIAFAGVGLSKSGEGLLVPFRAPSLVHGRTVAPFHPILGGRNQRRESRAWRGISVPLLKVLDEQVDAVGPRVQLISFRLACIDAEKKLVRSLPLLLCRLIGGRVCGSSDFLTTGRFFRRTHNLETGRASPDLHLRFFGELHERRTQPDRKRDETDHPPNVLRHPNSPSQATRPLRHGRAALASAEAA